MRTTIVVDEGLLAELLAVGGFRSRSEAINKAIEEYVSRRKREGVLELKGKIRFEEGHLKRLEEAEKGEQ
ncbi:MAG: type II toxin-antitoxin system VapB family antitoxin [Chloroflexi bacterium]|nr:MAG: type II toxin-antitoxin system VapB family antitoxin [Chloroflexota bacterium]